MSNDVILFEDFEKAVMEYLLVGQDQESQILYQQYHEGKTKEREFTNIGFYTHFEIAEHSPRITVECDGPVFTEAIAKINDNVVVMLMLFVTDVGIDFLEGFTPAHVPLPKIIEKFELSNISWKDI